VAEVAVDPESEVAPHRPERGLHRVRRPEEDPPRRNRVGALEHHLVDGRRGHVLKDLGVKGLTDDVRVVLVEDGRLGFGKLGLDEPQAFVLETCEDPTREPTHNAIRLNHDESSLVMVVKC